MVTVNLEYTGALRTVATHEPSRATMDTDAPADNHGKGETFSPTDLCATALAACMVTTMGIKGRSRGWNLVGAKVRVDKIMSADTPRRIARLDVDLQLPDRFDKAEKRELVKIAHTCPVYLSLNPSIEMNVNLRWI